MDKLMQALERVRAAVMMTDVVKVSNKYGWMMDGGKELLWAGEPYGESCKVYFMGDLGFTKDLALVLGLDETTLSYKFTHDPQKTEPELVDIPMWMEESAAQNP